MMELTNNDRIENDSNDIIKESKNKKVLVYSNLLATLDQLSLELNNCKVQSQNLKKQGLVFGYQDDHRVELSQLYPISNLEWTKVIEEIQTVVEHLEKSRLDFVLMGLYIVSDNFNLNNSIINLLLKLNVCNDQSVIIFHNPYSKTTSIKRLSHKINVLNYEAEIKDYNNDFEVNVFNKQYTENILVNVSYSEVQNVYSLLNSINNKELVKFNNLDISESIEKEEMKNSFKEDKDKTINADLSTINSLSEKLIEEQIKYINYYKTKKAMGVNKHKELEDLVVKRIGDFNNFQKLDLGVTLQNLKSEITELRATINC